MLKVKPPDGYPPEEGRYVRGNDFSPVAVCVILDTFDFGIPPELQQLVMAGVDAGAALSGTLQTENLGIEKMICNVVANSNIRYIVLCGRESAGHLPGESLLALKQNGIDERKQIVGSAASTPYLYNIPVEVIDRFNNQIASIINLLCKPGERDTQAPGLNPDMIEKAVWSCYQEDPAQFMDYTLYDIGAYPEPEICHKIVSKVTQQTIEPGKSKMSVGLMLHKLLPKTNCQKCGKRTCLAFAVELAKGRCRLEQCPILDGPEFTADRQALARLLE